MSRDSVERRGAPGRLVRHRVHLERGLVLEAPCQMARHAGRVITTLLVAAGLCFGALLVLPAALGWQRYVIVSGSMTGTYDRGSLVLDEVVPVSQLRAGDVITYRPPAGAGPEGLVTHRIASIA